MVCREPLLRYTIRRAGNNGASAMVCREPLLRYTLPFNLLMSNKLWFAGNRC
jgi:hypothetical protein